MKIIFVLCCSSLFRPHDSFVTPFQLPNNAIRWGTRELVWEDFKGRSNPQGLPKGAETMSVLHIELSEPDPKSQQAIVEAVFHPAKSWVSNKSPELLQHEKGHFAISELYDRKLRKQLAATPFKSTPYEDQAILFFQQMNKEMDKYQMQYDMETDYSRNAVNQGKWNESIDRQLKELESFSDVIVKLNVVKQN